LLVTFFLTVLVDLTSRSRPASCSLRSLFMRRMAEISKVGYVTRLGIDNGDGPAHADAGLHVPDGVKVFEIYGAFFFGAASKFKDAIAEVAAPPKVLVLRLRDVPAIDATALRALRTFSTRRSARGTQARARRRARSAAPSARARRTARAHRRRERIPRRQPGECAARGSRYGHAMRRRRRAWPADLRARLAH
jgi:MFS superfamily sulfate permease-like transporter